MRNIRSQVVSVVRSAVRSVSTHKTLDALERGALTQDQWRIWAVQRYKAAAGFVSLLEAGIDRADESWMFPLGQALNNNLKDEIGYVNGVVQPHLAHSQWRADLYGAMGVEEKQLTRAENFLFGLTLNIGVTVDLVRWGTAHQIAGAILFLEHFIPTEFRRVRKGLYPAFPDVFMNKADDDPATRDRKMRARLYLDDHIEHDSRDHFPQLLDAVVACTGTQSDVNEIRQGVRLMANARRHFYTSLGRSLRIPSMPSDTE